MASNSSSPDETTEMKSIQMETSDDKKDKKMMSKCIKVLTGAKNDNEKLASLFLVPKTITCIDKLDAEALGKIYAAIGEDYLIRLLSSEDEESGPLMRNVAVSVLSAFAKANFVGSCNPVIVEKLVKMLDDASEDVVLTTDIVICLVAYSTRRDGQKLIISADGKRRLMKLYVDETINNDVVIQVIRNILPVLDRQQYDECADKFFAALVNNLFTAEEDEKCDLCETVAEVLYSFEASCHINSEKLKSQSGTVLQCVINILLDEVPKKQKQKALILAAAWIDVFTLDQLLISFMVTAGQQLFIMLVHLSCIEVRVCLETDAEKKSVLDSTLLTSSYVIIEKTIEYLVSERSDLEHYGYESHQKHAIYESLRGAVGAVVFHLSQIPLECVPCQSYSEELYLCANIKVISCWMAEDSEYSPEMYTIVPLLMKVAKYNFQWEQKYKGDGPELADVLKFIQPGLLNITFEEESRDTVLTDNFDSVIISCTGKKFDLLCARLSAITIDESRDELQIPEDLKTISSSLETSCAILLNFLVSSSEVVKKRMEYWNFFKSTISKFDKVLLHADLVVLRAKMCVVGMLTLRHFTSKFDDTHHHVCKFMTSCISFLWDVLSVRDSPTMMVANRVYKDNWTEIKEFWDLAMDNMGHLLRSVPWLSQYILDCGWPQSIVEKLGKLPPIGSVEAEYDPSTWQQVLTMDMRLIHFL